MPSGAPTGSPPPGGGGGGGGHQEPTDDKRYLRGTQVTDKSGYVEFKTIFPGWYQGRCVHIHTKVHVDGKLTDTGYKGGHACHTGQLFFAETAVLDSAKVAPTRRPRSGRRWTRTRSIPATARRAVCSP